MAFLNKLVAQGLGKVRVAENAGRKALAGLSDSFGDQIPNQLVVDQWAISHGYP